VPSDFEFEILGLKNWDEQNDNLDVVVKLADGSRFTATFFTIDNILALFDKNKGTGECLSGLYLWSANMILVKKLTADVISQAIEDLLREGEFHSAFACATH
jgi:hypothetical protein